MGLSILSTSMTSLAFRTRLIAVLLILLPGSLAGQDGDDKTQESDTAVVNSIEVDEKQTTPIFVFDISGGMRLAPVAKQQPMFQVFADGRVVAGGNSRTLSLSGKLTPVELNKFLEFVVNTNDFFAIDQAKVVEKIRAGKQPVRLADAPYSKFTLDIKKGKNAISIYALFNTVKNFPKMDELVRLRAIETEVARISSQIHLGDDGEEVLKVVNEAVKKKTDYKIEPFTISEISRANRLPNSRFQVQFTRKAKADGPLPAGAAPLPDLNVIYFRKDKISAPVVSFYGLPKK